MASNKKRPASLSTQAAASFQSSQVNQQPAVAASAAAVSDEVRAQVQEAFELFNSSGRDAIDEKELELALSALGIDITKEAAKKLIADVDTEGSKTIKFADFSTYAIARLSERSIDDEIIKAFRLFDPENTGRITAKNLKHIATVLGEEASDQLLQDMIAEADSTHTGSVSQADFVRILKRAGL